MKRHKAVMTTLCMNQDPADNNMNRAVLRTLPLTGLCLFAGGPSAFVIFLSVANKEWLAYTHTQTSKELAHYTTSGRNVAVQGLGQREEHCK